MKMAHNHPPGERDDAPQHICMWESHGHDPSALSMNHDFLQEQNNRNMLELQRLRALLTEHNISWRPDNPSFTSNRSPNTQIRGKQQRVQGLQTSSQRLPGLPREIQFLIIAYALKSSTPIIDPFFKLRNENLTAAELKHSGRDDITIGLLGVCKAFNVEGTKLLVESNHFIFTKITALENFARIPQASRATIKHVVTRV